MSSLFSIQCSTGSYKIFLENRQSKMRNPSIGSRVCVDNIIMSSVSLDQYDIVIPINAIETNKTLDEVGRIIVALKKNSVTRNDKIDVIGGGILQDIGTLSASDLHARAQMALLPDNASRNDEFLYRQVLNQSRRFQKI